jgi:DNA-binding GntR family transcriptional regulator
MATARLRGDPGGHRRGCRTEDGAVRTMHAERTGNRSTRLLGGAVPGTAAEEAYRYVLNEIRRGKYHPGDRLRAEKIASAIDMSRMPVREAFGRLAAEGLLTIRPNRGAIVSVLTREDVQEIFEIRAVLEGLAVRLALPNLDKRALAKLDHLLQEMSLAPEERNGEEWMAQHRGFHEYLCGFSHRPRLVQEIACLHTAVEPYVRLWFIHAEGPLSMRREHEVIMEAVRSGDAERAEAVMKEHVLTTAPELAPYLHGAGAEDAPSEQPAQARMAPL